MSGNGEQGADPNRVLTITDSPGATTPGPGEGFRPVRSAGSGEVLRGVSFTPAGDSINSILHVVSGC